MANLQLCIIINLKTSTLYTNLFTNWGDKLFKCIYTAYNLGVFLLSLLCHCPDGWKV